MELLVAMTLAAVVAVMVFPVFVEAKNAARESNCKTNLKQIGAALQMYRDDWGSSILTDSTPRKWGQNGWMEKAYAYHRSMNIYKCPSRDVAFAYSLNQRLVDEASSTPVKPSVFICAFEAPGTGASDTQTISSADMNLCNTGSGIRQGDGAVSVSSLRNSNARTYDYRLWRDAGETPYHGWLLFPGPHGGANNILFYDGHVRKFSDWRNGSMTFDPRGRGYS